MDARARGHTKRESVLLKEFQNRFKASKFVDKRFGETDKTMTNEEKMLKRFQKVRSNKRQGRFHLGDDAPLKDELTHMGQSLSEVLEQTEIEQEDDEENLDQESFKDVNRLVERLKAGESLASLENKTNLTKKEVMMDVMKKSKLLKMERQREKENDEDERDRVDALMSDVVMSGGLSFRPTGEGAKEAQRAENRLDAKTDDYERIVKELQIDSGPKAAATSRSKSPEEIAADELQELERLEEARLKRLAGDEDDDDVEVSDADSNDEGSRRKRRKKSSAAAEPINPLTDLDDSIPFLVDCFTSHAELLEFLSQYPQGRLGLILDRVRKSTSIHGKAENRGKLVKLMQVLIDHSALLGERFVQLNDLQAKEDLINVFERARALASDVDSEVPNLFLQRLDLIRRSLDAHLLAAGKVGGGGGDYGSAQAKTSKPTVQVKPKGGHKDKLHEVHNAMAERLGELRGDVTLYSSPVRCWPSPGDFTFYAFVLRLFSSTDFRHAVCTSTKLLLARTLSECPLRGPRDVMAALQTAQLLVSFAKNDNKRYAPEALTFLRVLLYQLGAVSAVAEDTAASTRPVKLYELDSSRRPGHASFDAIRRAVGKGLPLKHEKLLSLFSESTDDFAKASTARLLRGSAWLIESCAMSLRGVECADVLLDPIITSVDALESSACSDAFKSSREFAQGVADQIRRERKALRLQEFAPVEASYAPRFREEANTAKRPNQTGRVLKRKLTRERKGVARELRLDGQFLARASQEERKIKTDAARSERRKNFRELEGTQAAYNRMVKEGIAIKGAGVGGLNLKGRRMGKRTME